MILFSPRVALVRTQVAILGAVKGTSKPAEWIGHPRRCVPSSNICYLMSFLDADAIRIPLMWEIVLERAERRKREKVPRRDGGPR